jgi:undecaprenyl-diphosphatase
MDYLIVFSAQYLLFVIGLIAVAVTLLSERTERNKLIILAALSILIAFGMASLAGILYYDPRPFVVEHISPLIPHIPDNGFPSDHTLYGMVTAATVFIYRRKTGIILGILAVLAGAARVIAGVHHPIDIIGGAAMAIVATFISWVLFKSISGKKIVTKLISF